MSLLYNDRWFKTASLDKLESERKRVQADYRNPKLDIEYRGKLWELFPKFDNAISKRKGTNQEYHYPPHREHGWRLPNDD